MRARFCGTTSVSYATERSAYVSTLPNAALWGQLVSGCQTWREL